MDEHCTRFCRKTKHGEYHYHANAKRKRWVRRHARTGLALDRADDLRPRKSYDVAERGAIRAAERNL